MMNILDYTDKQIDADTFVTLINNARKENKNRWYGFAGTVAGKKVVLKGIGTWLQQYIVDGLNRPSGMDISVKQFNADLIRPFTGENKQ